MELFFLQIQGSGQLELENGDRVRLAYADQNGHPYRSLGRYLDYQQRIDAVRSKIISAAIYPVILLLVGGGVSGFLRRRVTQPASVSANLTPV